MTSTYLSTYLSIYLLSNIQLKDEVDIHIW